MQLDRAEQRQLLAVAREAIEAAVRRASGSAGSATLGAATASLPPGLSQPAAAFVTIHEHGQLRGCIGLMRFDTPLWLNVRDAARAAALEDRRFLPVVESELPSLELEVSVLEPPVDLPDPEDFIAGRHGIIVEQGVHRALLLPQVADEMGWDEERMLDAVCRKANLPGDAWRHGARLQVFESTCFSESEAPRA
jgi:AmmeMemoRadiSam system protein A